MKSGIKRAIALIMMLLVFTMALTGCGLSKAEKEKIEAGLNNLIENEDGDYPDEPKQTKPPKSEDYDKPVKPTQPLKPGSDGGDVVLSYSNSRKEMSAKEIATYASTRVVMVQTDLGHGSGFFVDDNGTLVTNYHVIDGASQISIKFENGASYEVNTIVDLEPRHDVAVLRANLSGNDYFSFNTDPEQGETVFVIGFPKDSQTTALTQGVVSMTSHVVGIVDCITIDAAVSGGNSGGPALNSSGEVLGINTWGRADAQNRNYAIKPYAVEELGMNRNFKMSAYQDWYSMETSKSYMCLEDNYFYDSLVYTYTTVTGKECMTSTNLDGGKEPRGYSVGYLCYLYEYDQDSYAKYREYLASIGYVFMESDKEKGTETVTYMDPMDGYVVMLIVDTVNSVIGVTVPMLG